MFQYSFSINFHNLSGLHSLCIFLFLFFTPISAFAATSIPFTINMSKAVNVTGTPRIAIDVGGVARYATYTSGSGTSALTFTHTIVAGDVDLDGITLTSTIDLNGGTIKDLAGNDLSPLTFTAPNTTNVKVNYPSLGMDFVYDADGRYTLNGTAYNDLATFLSNAGGTYTRASVGTYFDSAGVLQTAASGVPRFDYDPTTHVAKGILIEESRTNTLTYSNNLSTNWTNFGSGTTTVLSTTESAPDGTTTAVKLNCTRADTAKYTARKYNAALTLSGQNTSSIWVKAADATNVGKTITFWQYNGSVQNVTNYTLTASWARITFNNSFSFSGSVSEPFNIGFLESSKGGSTDLNATFVVWGAQIEQGTFATSYIPTTTAAVTRAADTLTIPTGSWFNATAMTLAAEYSSYATNGYSTRIISVNDAATNAYQLADAAAGTIFSQKLISGVSNNSSGPTYVPGTTYKVAGAMDATSSPFAINNTLYSNSIAGTPTGLNKLQVGNQNSLNYLNGQIKKAKYYPVRVSNTQLQLMTQ